MRFRPAYAGAIVLRGFLVLACGCGGGSDDGTTAPPPSNSTASFSGTVKDEERGNAPVAGAKVAIAGVSTTATQDGSFTLTHVPLGLQHVTVSATGFDTTTWDVQIVSGTNQATVPLGPTNTYVTSGNALVYVPSGTTSVRGAVVVVYGGTSDSRPLLYGNLGFYTGLAPAGDVAPYRAALRKFARENGFAVVGVSTGQATSSEVTQALTAAGSKSNRPELANLPLVLQGLSSGGCRINAMVRDIPSRVIGFVTMKYDPGCGFAVGSPASSVPGYFMIGSADDASINNGMTTDFETLRARGAIWALVVEPGTGHTWSGFHEQIFNWIVAVANLRLPTTVTAGAPVALRAVNESSGWLADRTSFLTAGFPCFPGDKLKASWLPTEASARDWQMIVKGSAATVVACP